ncbi:MAG: hypothetical protein H0W47_15720 [Polaromonas sp.]|nr:hypothetical protein [Polaromonas sp.]
MKPGAIQRTFLNAILFWNEDKEFADLQHPKKSTFNKPAGSVMPIGDPSAWYSSII